MKIRKLETIGDAGIFYKITVDQRTSNWYEFWNRQRMDVVYIGNQLGWYEADTGFSVRSPWAIELLTAAVRADMLKRLVKEEVKKSKPTLSILKKEDD